MAVLDRVKMRLSRDDLSLEEGFLNELILTASDRINLRLGVEALPLSMESIAVDVVIKMYRRLYYEGISDGGEDTLSQSFVEDILSEYREEFSRFLEKQNKRMVTFL